jgi:hypothetical protein
MSKYIVLAVIEYQQNDNKYEDTKHIKAEMQTNAIFTPSIQTFLIYNCYSGLLFSDSNHLRADS